MTMARVAGVDFDLDAAAVERSIEGLDPEPIQEHYAVIGGRRFPPKQVLAAITGLDRADFTTAQAVRCCGACAWRVPPKRAVPDRRQRGVGPHDGAEATVLEHYAGRWVAQEGLEIVFDADSVDGVLQWIRRHGRRARVWRVPSQPSDVGSTQSLP